MNILDIGMLVQGNTGETDEGIIRLYDVNDYPVVELCARTDDDGAIFDSDVFMDNLAKEVVKIWNNEVIRQCGGIVHEKET